MNIRLLLKALSFGAAASMIGSLVVVLAGGTLVGYVSHPLEAWPWFIEISLVPTLATALVLGRVAGRVRPTRGLVIWASLLAAFIAVVLSGSLGAVLVESWKRGLASVNVLGYCGWSVVYGVALLPISFPLAALVTRGLWGRSQLTTGSSCRRAGGP